MCLSGGTATLLTDPCPACSFRPFHPKAWDPEWGAAAGAELGRGICRVLFVSPGLCSLAWPLWVKASALLLLDIAAGEQCFVQSVKLRDSHRLHLPPPVASAPF